MLVFRTATPCAFLGRSRLNMPLQSRTRQWQFQFESSYVYIKVICVFYSCTVRALASMRVLMDVGPAVPGLTKQNVRHMFVTGAFIK
jgi:hypothetical protein